jgi:hypothetical protein
MRRRPINRRTPGGRGRHCAQVEEGAVLEAQFSQRHLRARQVHRVSSGSAARKHERRAQHNLVLRRERRRDLRERARAAGIQLKLLHASRSADTQY